MRSAMFYPRSVSVATCGYLIFIRDLYVIGVVKGRRFHIYKETVVIRALVTMWR